MIRVTPIKDNGEDKAPSTGPPSTGPPSTESPSNRAPQPVRFQFGLRLLLLVTAMVCVASAMLGGMYRGGADRYIYVVLGIAAPMGVMIVVSVISQIVQYFEKRR